MILLHMISRRLLLLANARTQKIMKEDNVNGILTRLRKGFV